MNIVEKYTFSCGIIIEDIERAIHYKHGLYKYIKISFTDVCYFRYPIDKETFYKI